jgi:hypothetical protein
LQLGLNVQRVRGTHPTGYHDQNGAKQMHVHVGKMSSSVECTDGKKPAWQASGRFLCERRITSWQRRQQEQRLRQERQQA